MAYRGAVSSEKGFLGFLGSWESCIQKNEDSLKSKKRTDTVAYSGAVRSGCLEKSLLIEDRKVSYQKLMWNYDPLILMYHYLWRWCTIELWIRAMMYNFTCCRGRWCEECWGAGACTREYASPNQKDSICILTNLAYSRFKLK